MVAKPKRIQVIYIIYWVMLAYMVAMLIWWLVALNNQSEEMANYMLESVSHDSPDYEIHLQKIEDYRHRKWMQFLGEGATFLLLIFAAAIFIFRQVRKQFRFSHERQTFMMAITHELKTPIAVARLNLETLQKRNLPPETQQKFMHNTLQEIYRMNALCSNLLMSSHFESGEALYTPEEIDFTKLVEECVQETRQRFPDRKFETLLEEHIVVTGDRFQLQIVVNNLLDNAVKYSKEEIKIVLQKDDKQIYLSIADKGQGISDADKTLIFDKFYRSGNAATRSAKGTGLGLYLVRKIVHKHKGHISIKDNQPVGSIFVIQLPHNHP